MSMTRRDARMIAEELYRLMRDGKTVPERYLGAKEAAAMLGMPIGTLYHKLPEIPHTKVGRRLRFTESSLRAYIED